MSVYRFERFDGEPDAPGWRPLDRAIWRWTAAHGGSPLLATVAAWASLADGEGDTALPLDGGPSGRHGMPQLSPDERARLAREPLISAGEQPAPFVLDPQGRFYLWRNYAHELAVARRLHERRAAARQLPGDPAALDELFGGQASPSVARQRQAVAALAGRKLFVLTGGPGTGKTTTVLRMLLMLYRQEQLVQPRIRVSAPTGKAAQRLLQALRSGKQALARALPAHWAPALACIPEDEAPTLHRLLAFDPRRHTFGRDAKHPLAADIVVVDEASMIDLAMLHALLEAVPAQATLILVGDADQLTSVAAGSVMLDLVTALEAVQAPDLVRLEHSFRAVRQLVPINQAVRAGDSQALRRAVAAAAEHATLRRLSGGESLRRELARWADGLAALPIRPRLPAWAGAGGDPAAARARATSARDALQALSERQLLCALREDSHGARELNELIEARLRQRWDEPEDRVWYPGRAVLITRNDHAARLYNGDIGLCLADEEGQLLVWFESSDADGRPSARGLSPGSLPAHEGAFAITIHKSQGSEYACAAVLLPPDPEHRILSRQLLYTGVSRAKQAVELWVADTALDAALARPVSRASGLAERLAGDAAASTRVTGAEPPDVVQQAWPF